MFCGSAVSHPMLQEDDAVCELWKVKYQPQVFFQHMWLHHVCEPPWTLMKLLIKTARGSTSSHMPTHTCTDETRGTVLLWFPGSVRFSFLLPVSAELLRSRPSSCAQLQVKAAAVLTPSFRTSVFNRRCVSLPLAHDSPQCYHCQMIFTWQRLILFNGASVSHSLLCAPRDLTFQVHEHHLSHTAAYFQGHPKTFQPVVS